MVLIIACITFSAGAPKWGVVATPAEFAVEKSGGLDPPPLILREFFLNDLI